MIPDLEARREAVRKGELAARMVRVACLLAGAVRTADRDAIGEFLDREVRTEEEVRALLVVQAAMTDVSQTPADLLRWVVWDEYGRPIDPVNEPPVPLRARGQPVVHPCGTHQAYGRHTKNGEVIDEWCAEAGREERQRRKDEQAAEEDEAA